MPLLKVVLDEPVFISQFLHQFHYLAVGLPQQRGQVLVALLDHVQLGLQHQNIAILLLHLLLHASCLSSNLLLVVLKLSVQRCLGAAHIVKSFLKLLMFHLLLLGLCL